MRAALIITLALLLGGCDTAHRPQETTQTSIAALKGQWVVINYWARWCKPCVKEIPELNKLNQQHTDITVLGVNYDGATGYRFEITLDRAQGKTVVIKSITVFWEL